MPAQPHSALRLNVTGIDFPGLAVRIEKAISAGESSADLSHTFILTDDTDSLRSNVTNLLK